MIDYSKIIPENVREIKPSGIRRFFDIANSMEGVISLGVGEPDFLTPWKIRNAGIKTLERGGTRYTSNRGDEALRRELSTYISKRYGVDYDHNSEMLVTVGGSEAIDAAIRAIVTNGDEVIIPEPSYVCYEPICRLSGACVVSLPTRAEEDFRVTAKALRERISERTKLLVLPYPSNPTGAIMNRADIEAIADVLEGTNIMVLSDEIYAELTFGVGHTSVASVSGMKERTVLVGGFSKSFSMTGWRLGYLCAPKPITDQILKIHQYAIMCAPTVSQSGALEALRSCEEETARMKDEYDARRRIIVSGFNKLGLECREPQGAFYAFPSITSTGLSCEEFCERLLYSKKVALVPGTAFGKSGEGHVRASYCYSLPHIREALSRIGEFLEELKNEQQQ